MMKRWFFTLLVGAMVLLALAGCREDGPLPTPATIMPGDIIVPSDPVAEIELSYPAEVSWGESFGITVTNVGTVALELYEQRDCLAVQPATGLLALHPDMSCDVITVQTMLPGESRGYGTWDLRACPDLLCLARGAAPAGDYYVDVTAWVKGDDGEVVGEPLVRRAEFSLVGEMPAVAQTPRTNDGKLFWYLPDLPGEEHRFTGVLPAGTEEQIKLLMHSPAEEGWRKQANFTLLCEQPAEGHLGWFAETVLPPGYPTHSRTATAVCGQTVSVDFTRERNSATLYLSLTPNSPEPLVYTLTAQITGSE